MLEDYYKGDKCWENFMLVFPEHSDLESNEEYNRLLESIGRNKELARVIFELIGEDFAYNWVNRENRALDGLKPVDCTEGILFNRLKALLMRL